MGRVAPVGGARGIDRIRARDSPGRMGPFMRATYGRGKESVLGACQWMPENGRQYVGAELGAADQPSASQPGRSPIGRRLRKR